MILGIGTDIIEIDRIAAVLQRHGSSFLDRIFTKKEQQYVTTTASYAAHFAGKEAVSKALGTGIADGVSWKDIEIYNKETGEPFVQLAPHIMTRFQNPRVFITLSHSKQHAVAFAVISL